MPIVPGGAPDVIVIGAGIAGLAASRELQAAGHRVVVLDKARGVSGRAATRQWAGRRIDHGAQFFTARSPAFIAQVDAWLADGTCFRWATGFHQWRSGQLLPPDAGNGQPRFACADGMSTLGKSLAAGLNVVKESLVTRIVTEDGATRVQTSQGEVFRGSHLMVSVPAPQARLLFDESFAAQEPTLWASLGSIAYAPYIACACLVDGPRPEWKGIQLDDRVLAWIGADSTKRDSGRGLSVYMLHGFATFSEARQDRDLEAAGEKMIARAREITGDVFRSIKSRMLHRWRYALVIRGINGIPFLRSSQGRRVYFIGDAFLGARIEGAYLSGIQAARDLLSSRLATAD